MKLVHPFCDWAIYVSSFLTWELVNIIQEEQAAIVIHCLPVSPPCHHHPWLVHMKSFSFFSNWEFEPILCSDWSSKILGCPNHPTKLSCLGEHVKRVLVLLPWKRFSLRDMSAACREIYRRNMKDTLPCVQSESKTDGNPLQGKWSLILSQKSNWTKDIL